MEDKNEGAKINQQAIFDIINNIQEKMGNSDNKSTENLHINEVSKDKASSSSNNSSPSLQNILGNIDMNKITSLLGNFSSSQSSNDNNTTSNSNSNSSNAENNNINFDINTILKMQKIMSKLNRDDPKKNLLMSLKPFLRKTRQDKLDTYMSLLNIWDLIGIFGEGRDLL